MIYHRKRMIDSPSFKACENKNKTTKPVGSSIHNKTFLVLVLSVTCISLSCLLYPSTGIVWSNNNSNYHSTGMSNNNNNDDDGYTTGGRSIASSTPLLEKTKPPSLLRKSVAQSYVGTINEKQNNNDIQEYDICIAGAGLSGSVIAERYASQLNQNVVIIEKRDHIGGNVYDYIDEETGIRVSQYGAHLFHTQYERVWDYVHHFSKWTKYEHEVLGLVNGSHVPIPVNIETVNELFGLHINTTEEMDQWLQNEQVKYDHEPQNSEEMALSRVGPRLYELIFHPYTIKQWDKEPKELGPEVTARIPVRNNHDKRYFGDPYQALPSDGYTAFFENLLCHPNIETRLNTDYFQVRDSLKCKKTYFTGPIDAYFAHLGYKKLEYRSLDFERKVVKDVGDSGFYQPKFVVNHPSPNDDFTRIVEYKHLLNQTSQHTILFVERSKDGGEPYYPVPNAENKALYAKYQALAAKEPDVTFVGRLANYKYFNMDQAILNALELFEKDNNIVYSTDNPDEKETVSSCVPMR